MLSEVLKVGLKVIAAQWDKRAAPNCSWMRNSHVSFTVISFFTHRLSSKRIPEPRAGDRGPRWGWLLSLRFLVPSGWWQLCQALRWCKPASVLFRSDAGFSIFNYPPLPPFAGSERQREGRRGWDRLCMFPAKCLQVSESTGGSQEWTHELQKGQEPSKERSEADLDYIFWLSAFTPVSHSCSL